MTHLADAVGELLRHQTLNIHYLPGDPARYYTARAPSLLAQLAELVHVSGRGRGGRTVPGSRLPLDAAALDLWVEITYAVHAWARELNVDRRPYLHAVDNSVAAANELWRAAMAPGIAPRVLVAATPTTDPTPPLGRLLRAVQGAAAPVELVAGAVARKCWCGRDTVDCGCWVHRIRAMVAPGPVDRDVRGVACPECGARTAIVERDRERLVMPAVVVRVAHLDGMGADDLWLYRMCRACGIEGWLDYRSESERTPA